MCKFKKEKSIHIHAHEFLVKAKQRERETATIIAKLAPSKHPNTKEKLVASRREREYEREMKWDKLIHNEKKKKIKGNSKKMKRNEFNSCLTFLSLSLKREPETMSIPFTQGVLQFFCSFIHKNSMIPHTSHHGP